MVREGESFRSTFAVAPLIGCCARGTVRPAKQPEPAARHRICAGHTWRPPLRRGR